MKGKVVLPINVPTIVCGACGYEYVHLVVLRGKDELTDEPTYQVWDQVKASYCPDCGYTNERVNSGAG